MLYPLISVFGVAAYFDYKHKRIPDVLTAIGWLVLVFAWFFYADSAPLLIAGASFAILFFINSYSAFLGKPIVMWGDILLVPVYAAYCSGTVSFTAFILLPLALLFAYVTVTGKNTHIALAPFLAASALISLLAA
jgi:prepilin signal peptidase PulO-like enzyme (type II secretory pathway)